MKSIKKIIIMVVCSLLVILLVNGSKKADAARKDVTNTTIDKGKLERLIYEFRDFLGYYADYPLENKLFDFSKKESRQRAIKFTYGNYGKLNRMAQNKLSRQLFGKGITAVTQILGEWGCSYPVLKISKIYKMSAKQFQIRIIIYMYDDDGGHEKKGEAAILVKKNSKAKYGYHVEKIRIF